MFLDWTNGMSPFVTQPPSSLQASGWVPGQGPEPDFMNWLFWLADQWIQWIDYEIENVLNAASGISASNVNHVLLTGSNVQLQLDEADNALGKELTVDGTFNATYTGTTNSTSPTITGLSSTVGLQVGQKVLGGNIAAGSYIVSISGTSVTMNQNASGSGSGSITFTSGTFYLITTVLTGHNGRILLVNTGINIVLPAPVDNFWFGIKDKSGVFDVSPCTLTQHSSEKIENLASPYTISAPYAAQKWRTDGTDWWKGAA